MRKGAAERFRCIRCNGADQFVIFAVAKSIFRCRPVAERNGSTVEFQRKTGVERHPPGVFEQPVADVHHRMNCFALSEKLTLAQTRFEIQMMLCFEGTPVTSGSAEQVARARRAPELDGSRGGITENGKCENGAGRGERRDVAADHAHSIFFACFLHSAVKLRKKFRREGIHGCSQHGVSGGAAHCGNVADVPFHQFRRNAFRRFSGQKMDGFDHLIDCGQKQEFRIRKMNDGAVVARSFRNLGALRENGFQICNELFLIHDRYALSTRNLEGSSGLTRRTSVPVGSSSSATAVTSRVSPRTATVTFPLAERPAGMFM